MRMTERLTSDKFFSEFECTENWCLDMTDRAIRLLVLDCDTENMILSEEGSTRLSGSLFAILTVIWDSSYMIKVAIVICVQSRLSI